MFFVFHKLEFSKHKNDNIFTSCFGFFVFHKLEFSIPLGDSNDVDILIANSDANHQEGLVNYRVGGVYFCVLGTFFLSRLQMNCTKMTN